MAETCRGDRGLAVLASASTTEVRGSPLPGEAEAVEEVVHAAQGQARGGGTDREVAGGRRERVTQCAQAADPAGADAYGVGAVGGPRCRR